MIQKDKNNQSKFKQGLKYYIDQFKNPYICRTTFKITPNTYEYNNKISLISIFDNNTIDITQSIPIYRNSKLKIAILWDQNFKNKYTRSHFGFSFGYQIINKWKFQTQMLFGNTAIISFSLSKKISKSTQIKLLNSTFIDHTDIFPTLGFQIVHKDLIVSINRRINLDTNITATYQTKIWGNFLLKIHSETQFSLPKHTIIGGGISYYLDNLTKIQALITHPIDQINFGIKFHVERQFSKFGNAQIDVEFKDNKSIFYIGYKTPSYNFNIPIIIIDNPIPIIVGGLLFLFGSLFCNKNKIKIKDNQNEKSQADRITELKLISDKANENYKRQNKQKGLLIHYAYTGPKDLLLKIKGAQNPASLIQNVQYINQVYDITQCLRLYVQNGELNLISFSKSLLGYYSIGKSWVLINYEINRYVNQIIVQQSDQIHLKN